MVGLRVQRAVNRSARRSRRRVRGKRQVYRPSFEVLENRITPSVFTVNTFFDTFAINLTTGQDSTGHVSLRSAVQAADATAGSSTIILAAGTYQLTQTTASGGGQLTISGTVDLMGAGAALTTVDANDLDRAFNVLTGGDLLLDGLTIENGAVTGMGGAVSNAGTLNVIDSVFSDNQATGASGAGSLSNPAPAGGTVNGFGGAIWNSGTLTITGTTFSGNSAIGGEGGSSVSYGSGGGGGGMGAGGAIFSAGGTVTVTGSTFSDNTAQGGDGNYAGPGYGGPGGSGGGVGGAGGDTGSPGSPGGDGSYGGGGGGGGSTVESQGGNGGDGGFGGGGGGGGSGIGEGDGGGAGGNNGFGAGQGGYAGYSSGGGGGGGLARAVHSSIKQAPRRSPMSPFPATRPLALTVARPGPAAAGRVATAATATAAAYSPAAALWRWST